MTITIDSALLKQAKDALIESVYLVREAYRTNWRHGIPARKAQLDAEKAALDAHEKAISDIEAALAAQPSEPPDKCGNTPYDEGPFTIVENEPQPSGPAWHDAPTVPGLWISNMSFRVNGFNESQLRQYSAVDGLRWFGPITEDTK